jgi:nuclear pore complex protein Nup62
LSFGGITTSVAPGGFSFGGTTDTKTTTPTASGFGFGGTTNASQTDTSATTTTTTTTPSTPMTPGNQPAPVATPMPPSATTTAQPSTTTTPTTNTTTTATAVREPTALDYQTLTVEQLLNKFQQELERDAVEYIEEARRIAEYDAILRDSQTNLDQLTEHTRRCILQQQEIEQTLSGVSAMQQELDKTLGTIETNVDELFVAQSHLVPQDADYQREEAYQTASEISKRLHAITDTLAQAQMQMDETQERTLTGDVAKIVKILQQHQTSLADLEDAGRRMEYDISQINRVLAFQKY